MKRSGDLASKQEAKKTENGRSDYSDPEGRIQMLPLDLASLDDRHSKALRHQQLNESNIYTGDSNQPECIRVQKSGQTCVAGKAQELAPPISGGCPCDSSCCLSV
jgi:hypothetical protein